MKTILEKKKVTALMCPYFKIYYKAMIINTGIKVGSRWWHRKKGL